MTSIDDGVHVHEKRQHKHGHGLKLLWQRCTQSFGASVPTCSKVENILANTVRNKAFMQALELLQEIVRELVISGVAAFASCSLTDQAQDTFGCVAISGRGAQFFPPLLREDGSELACTSFSLFSARVFAVSASNWSIEDAVQTGSPLYYDCSADASVLPQEAKWLKQAGMQRMLSLPCVHGGEVHGMLTVGLTSKNVDRWLILKLQQLSCEMTPWVIESKQSFCQALAPRSQLRRFESQGDIALAVVEEILNLDEAVISKLEGGMAAKEQCKAVQRDMAQAAAMDASKADNHLGLEACHGTSELAGAAAACRDAAGHDSASSLSNMRPCHKDANEVPGLCVRTTAVQCVVVDFRAGPLPAAAAQNRVAATHHSCHCVQPEQSKAYEQAHGELLQHASLTRSVSSDFCEAVDL